MSPDRRALLDAPTCNRRPGSVWTKCPCDRCRVRNVRVAKYAQSGVLNLPNPQLAVDRINAWHAAGFSDEWIATACGANKWQIHRVVARTRQGHPVKLIHATTRLILAADIRDGSAGLGPSLGPMRRLRALNALGYTQDQISAGTGVAQGLLSLIVRGVPGAVTARNWHAIVDFYDRVSMTPGPSATARRNAAKRGWLPPLAWDDDTIDDPAAEPYTETRPTGARAATETAEEVADYLGHVDPFATASHLAERLGYRDVTGVQQALKRADRPDLLAQLARNAHIASNVTGRTA